MKISILNQITPVILTFNEAPNLGRCLEWLRWAKQIVVIDSGSTDETVAVAKQFSNMHLVFRPFDTHAQQWNFGISQTDTPWVLSLDADYILSEQFIKELETWQPSEDVHAAFARFRYCIFGRSLRGTLYPPRAVLFRKDRCHYVQNGHTQRLQIEGRSVNLDSVIDHDDRKTLSHWLWSQDRYATLEAAKLTSAPKIRLSLQDRLRRRIIVAPVLVFVYTLFVKRLVFDGWPGWYYVFQRTLAEIILSLRLLEAKLKHSTSAR